VIVRAVLARLTERAFSEADVQVLTNSFRWYFVQVTKQKRTVEQVVEAVHTNTDAH
jgi:hypothetical protein